MDKISTISPKIFGSEQAGIEKTKICSDCQSGPPKCQICLDWPQNYYFCLAKCKETNKQCHNPFPMHPIRDRIFFANTNPFSLIPFVVERIIHSVNDDGILKSHWFEQVSSVQDNKQMRNSKNLSGHRVAPQSCEYILGVSTPSDLQNQENMYQ